MLRSWDKVTAPLAAGVAALRAWAAARGGTTGEANSGAKVARTLRSGFGAAFCVLVLRSGAKEVVFEEIQDCEEVCLFDHVQGDAVKEFLDLLMYVEEEGVG